MEALSKSDLRQLGNNHSGPCVSLYLPTHRSGVETLQDPIRLRNLLRQAETGLQASGQRAAEISQLLRPARELLEDYDFWQHQSDGLAILSSPEMFRLFRLQLPVPELAVTSDRFHLNPLMACIAASGHYYVLALSRKRVRVYVATRESMVEVQGRDLPETLLHTLRDYPKQQHTLPHRQGGGEGDRKEMPLAHFQQLDEGVRDLLGQNHAPVVLAAADDLNAIYRQANTSGALLDEWISGDPDGFTLRELHERADHIASAYFAKDQAKAADQYLRLWYTGRSANTLAQILPAACQGRVQFLFVSLGVQVWGRFDESRSQTVLFDDPTPESQDLLNLAAIQTFVTGGAVYPVAAEAVPGGASVAAVFRY